MSQSWGVSMGWRGGTCWHSCHQWSPRHCDWGQGAGQVKYSRSFLSFQGRGNKASFSPQLKIWALQYNIVRHCQQIHFRRIGDSQRQLGLCDSLLFWRTLGVGRTINAITLENNYNENTVRKSYLQLMHLCCEISIMFSFFRLFLCENII